MSRVIDNDGNVVNTKLFFECYKDDRWTYHHTLMMKFKRLKEQFEELQFNEYKMLSLREEELIDHEI